MLLYHIKTQCSISSTEGFFFSIGKILSTHSKKTRTGHQKRDVWRHQYSIWKFSWLRHSVCACFCVWCNGDRGRKTASSSPHSFSLSICSAALPQFTTSGMRRLEQLLKLSVCVCVLIHTVCQLRGIIHQSESSCTLSVSIGLVIGFRLNLAKKFPPWRQERHFVCPFSLSVGDVMDRGVCVSCVNKSI